LTLINGSSNNLRIRITPQFKSEAKRTGKVQDAEKRELLPAEEEAEFKLQGLGKGSVHDKRARIQS